MENEIRTLKKHQKEADIFKKQVDKQVKESTKAANNSKIKNDEEKMKVYFKGCYDLKVQAEDLLKKANGLLEENELSKIKDFEKKKTAEINRITTFQTQLQTAMDKVLPDEKGVAYLKELKGEDEEVEEEEDEEEEEEGEEEEEEGEDEEEEGEDEEEEEDEEEDTVEGKGKGKPVEKLKIDRKDDEEDEESEYEEDEDEYETDDEETEQKKPVVTKKEKMQKEEKEEDEEEDDDDEEEDDEEEDEEEEEDEDEEDEDEEQEEKGKKKKKKAVPEDTLEVTSGEQLLFEALCDYKGDQPGDLSFKTGEVLTIIQTREDGWWEAENQQGDKGIVPSTFLQAHNKYKDVQKEDEGEEEEEEDEGVDEGDETGEQTTRSGKKMWSSVRKAVHQKKPDLEEETSATDVLHALGAIPSGFRHSTLKVYFTKDDTYRMKNYLAPKLSKSNLFYRDLFFEPQKSQICPKIVKFDRIITITSCRQINIPKTAITVQSRFVRVCLFDGQNVLSNVHVVKVTSVDRSENTWSFSTKISDLMDPFQHAEVFVRTNHLPEKIGILFELGFTYVRNHAETTGDSKSNEEPGEFSCGWVLLDLYEQTTGALIGNKNFDLYVNGGTPYEKNVEVDPTISRRTTSNAFMSLLSSNKQPRLNVKISIPKREHKEQLDLLPDVLVGNASLLNIYSYYRQILADTLLKDRVDLESTELIHSPFLATFPEAADQMDLMKIFRETWIERTKVIRAPEKGCKKILFDLDVKVERDIEYMKTEFQLVFQSSVYPLIHLSSLPKYSPGDYTLEQKRQEEISKFKKQKIDRKGILALLLSSDIEYEPFDMKEVAFNVIGQFCQNDPMSVTVQS